MSENSVGRGGWELVCSECGRERDPAGLPTVCESCGAPWLVRYRHLPDTEVREALTSRPWNMWRYREWLPVRDEEEPVSLGEGSTNLIRVASLEQRFGLAAGWIKDEATNPTGSFKARGLSAAITRARSGGATQLVVPTAGNAGVALAAYAARAGLPARIYAPDCTPETIRRQITTYGGHLEIRPGHIGNCGLEARAFAADTGAFDCSTLREPYRIEGKKTMGLEIAEQLGWELPDAVIYPTGGGTGLIGMWKAFNELQAAGWIAGTLPKMFSVQSEGCAPVVRAYQNGDTATEAWADPETSAWGLRVPSPLGGKLILKALFQSQGAAVAVPDEAMSSWQECLTRESGIDLAPEGGAALAALESLVELGRIEKGDRVVIFNTGSGWLYR